MKSMWIRKEFTSSGSWVCPAGVTTVIVYGAGGGGGGSGGSGGSSNGTACQGGGSGMGGMGNPLMVVPLAVVPGTTYTITIGAGGTGGTGNVSPGYPASSSGNAGNDGSDTTFGALFTFKGAKGAYAATTGYYTDGPYRYGMMLATQAAANVYPMGGVILSANPGVGVGRSGHRDYTATASNGGAAGNSTGSFIGAPGGGGGMDGIEYPGITGAGAAGGQGARTSSGLAGTVGSNAAANSAAGGGGGGGNVATTSGNYTGATGGNGGSGFLMVSWVE